MSVQKQQKQIKNSLLYMGPTVLNNILPFLTLPIFTRILTQQDYGIFALAQVYAIFVTSIVNIGLLSAYERNYFKYQNQPRQSAQLLYTILTFVFGNFFIAALLTVLLSGPLSQLVFKTPSYGPLLLWALAAQFVMSVQQYYFCYLKNQENARGYAQYTILCSIINVVVSFCCIVILRLGVIGLILGQLVSASVVVVLLAAQFFKRLPLSWNFSLLREACTISLPLTPRIFLGVIGTQFDKYMINLLKSLGGAGIYAIGQKIAYASFVYMTAIEKVFAPQVYQKMFTWGQKGGRVIGKYLTPFAYASIAIAFLLILFAREVVTILTPAQYHSATSIVIVLTMYYGYLFFGKQPQLIYRKKTGLLSVISMASIGLNVILNIPFILKWGALGAAWATCLAGIISSTGYCIIAHRYYPIQWEYKKLTMIFGLFFFAGLVMIALQSSNIIYSIQIGIKGIFLIAYFWLGMKLAIITKENMKNIKIMLAPRKIPAQEC